MPASVLSLLESLENLTFGQEWREIKSFLDDQKICASLSFVQSSDAETDNSVSLKSSFVGRKLRLTFSGCNGDVERSLYSVLAHRVSAGLERHLIRIKEILLDSRISLMKLESNCISDSIFSEIFVVPKGEEGFSLDEGFFICQPGRSSDGLAWSSLLNSKELETFIEEIFVKRIPASNHRIRVGNKLQICTVYCQQHFDPQLEMTFYAIQIYPLIISELPLFSAILAHEIKTPLSCMLSLVELAKDCTNLEQRNSHLDSAKHCGEDVIEIFDSLMLSSKGTPSAVKLDSLHLIHFIIQRTEGKAHEKQIVFDYRFTELVPRWFVSSPTLIRQILLNLLYNAIKFSPPQSTVIIFVEYLQGNVIFKVKDQGPGMSPDFVKNRLFKAFARENDSCEGTGLGLYLTKLLVTRLGGTITCSVDHGTTFVVCIPANARSILSIYESLLPDEFVDQPVPLYIYCSESFERYFEIFQHYCRYLLKKFDIADPKVYFVAEISQLPADDNFFLLTNVAFPVACKKILFFGKGDALQDGGSDVQILDLYLTICRLYFLFQGDHISRCKLFEEKKLVVCSEYRILVVEDNEINELVRWPLSNALDPEKIF